PTWSFPRNSRRPPSRGAFASGCSPIPSRPDPGPTSAVSTGPVSKRKDELAYVAGRNVASAGDAVRLRPAVGEVEGAEDAVEHREVNREVLVHGFGLGAVVPVMEGRGGEPGAERPQPEAQVGVYEGGLHDDPDHVGEDRGLAEPQDVDGDV